MKKKVLVALALLVTILSANAQDVVVSNAEAKKDTAWKFGGFFGLNLAQTSLSNWQGGGQDNIAFSGLLNVEAVYKKKKSEWINRFDGQYGIVCLLYTSRCV